MHLFNVPRPPGQLLVLLPPPPLPLAEFLLAGGVVPAFAVSAVAGLAVVAVVVGVWESAVAAALAGELELVQVQLLQRQVLVPSLSSSPS